MSSGEGSAPSPPAARLALPLLVLGSLLVCGLCNLLILAVEVPSLPGLGASTLAALAGSLLYLLILLQLDRFEYEPVRLLAAAFVWGALVAGLMAYVLNSLAYLALADAAGEAVAELLTGGVVAPVVEEAAKGLALLGLLLLARHEFDNVLDGIVYGSLVGLGFALTENVLYFGRIYLEEGLLGVGVLFYLRSLVGVGGLGHPLFSATLGAGVGLARERGAGLLAALAIAGGYVLAVAQHAAWNLAVGAVLPVLYGLGGLEEGTVLDLFLVAPLLGLVLLGPGALTLGVIAAITGRREAAILRTHLRSEVEAGELSQAELARLASPLGRQAAEMRMLLRRGIGGWRRMRQLDDLAVGLAFRRWRLARGEPLEELRGLPDEETARRRMRDLRASLGLSS